MRKRKRKAWQRGIVVLGTVVLCVGFSLSVHAADMEALYREQSEQSGLVELWGQLPDTVREAMQEAGIEEGKPDIGTAWEGVGSYLRGLVLENWQIPGRALGCMAVLILLYGAVYGTMPEKTDLGVLPACVAVCGIAVAPLLRLMQTAAGAIQGAGGFLLLCVPVYAGLLLGSGRPVGAGGSTTLLLLTGNGVTFLARELLLPVLEMFLAISLVSGCLGQKNGLTAALYKTIRRVLLFITALFMAFWGMQTVLSGTADSATQKAAGLLLGGVVPIVGNVVGNAAGAVQASLALIRSGAGAFGLLAMLFLFLPVFTECLLWLISFAGAAVLSQVCEIPLFTELFSACRQAVEMVLALVVSCAICVTLCAGLLLAL